MNKTEKLHRKILELLYSAPYEQCAERERYNEEYERVTIGRLLVALNATAGIYESYCVAGKGKLTIERLHYGEMDKVCEWVLIDDHRSELSLSRQSEETISALHNLLCND